MDPRALHPDFRPEPYWWDAAPPEEARDADLPPEADLVVIGSGFAGLSAALEAARAGAAVVVLDAGRLGGGASSRSGGMVSSGQKLVLTDALASLSEPERLAALQDSVGTYDFLRELIARERLDADFQQVGRFFGAFAPAHMARLRRNAEMLAEKTGVTVRVLSRDQQYEEVGSDYFHGGFVVEEYGGVHPAKYNQALRQRAREAGASLHSHARVLKTERQGAKHRVRTERRDILTGAVLYATNGYTDQASPWLQKRIAPVASYQIATEKLPPDVMRMLIPRLRMVTDSRKELVYTRPSPDGTRILFGCRPRMVDRPPERMAPAMRARMLRVWPQLAGYRITHAWQGFVGMTRDRLPHVAEYDGVMHAVGCNGNGVALMTWLGWHAAQIILRRNNRQSYFASIGFPSMPALLRSQLGVALATGAYQVRDFIDEPGEILGERLARPARKSSK
jgi:glycine/D-amino acid oxidase-like deaminating enzyme